MRLILSVILVISLFPINTLGQSNGAGQGFEPYLQKLTSSNTGKSRIIIQQDPRMALFVEKHATAMHQQQIQGIPGFRIRIFFDGSQSARMKMNQEKAHFMKMFDGISAYPDYKAPYWRIYVGDFRTSSEALKQFDRIRKVYPNALMVNDYIRIPEMKSQE